MELRSILLRPVPLDAEIEGRCKQAWKEAHCSECGETIIQTGDASPRVWCTNCRYISAYTHNNPIEDHTLTSSEIVIVSILYAEALLNAQPDHIAVRRRLRIDHTAIWKIIAAFERGFYVVLEPSDTLSTAQLKSTRLATSALGKKG